MKTFVFFSMIFTILFFVRQENVYSKGETMTAVKSNTYHCKYCSRAIFDSKDIIKKVNLWDLGDYQAQCYMIKQAKNIVSLRRYDCSLHEGWYCCRFILMRMVVDKFNTGNNLLVYTDAVTTKPGKIERKSHQIQLNAKDFDNVIATKNNRLKVVKLSAIWCPPCRLMDQVIAQIGKQKSLPQVDFFELDIDKERKLSLRFKNMSIPYILFYFNGKQIKIQSTIYHIVDGGIVGGLSSREFTKLCQKVYREATLGKNMVNYHE